MTMLLAEDLLLLLLDDARGSTPSVPVDEALGGAVLAELALAGAVVVQPATGWARSARVVPAGPAAAPLTDPVLQDALARVAERPRAASDLVGVLGRGLRPALSERLAQRGLGNAPHRPPSESLAATRPGPAEHSTRPRSRGSPHPAREGAPSVASMAMLIAEDLLLLLHDDERGNAPFVPVNEALGGALLAELVPTSQVVVRPPVLGLGEVVPADPPGPPPTDPVLRDALATVTDRPRFATDPIPLLGRGLRAVLSERLVERGLVRREGGGILGVFPPTRWPAVDDEHEAGVRARLTDALVHELPANPRTAAVDRLPAVVHHEGIGRLELRRRAREIAQGDWSSQAVRDSVGSMDAAMLVLVIAMSSSSSS